LFGTALNNAQLTHPLISSIHYSKHEFVPKAVTLNSWRRKTKKWHPPWTFTAIKRFVIIP